MKISIVFIVTAFISLYYGARAFGVHFWVWLGILLTTLFFPFLIFLRVAVWCADIFLLRKKGFSIACKKLYPFEFSFKSMDQSSFLKRFGLSVDLKGFSIQTNFKKAFFDFAVSSPFILEVDSLSVNVVARRKVDVNQGTVMQAPEDSPLRARKEVNPIHTPTSPAVEKEKSSSVNSLLLSAEPSFPRFLLPILRLFDFRINKISLSVGDDSFPSRLQLIIRHVVVNGTAQLTPSSSYSANLKIANISLNNRENEFGNQPNIVITNFWLRLTAEFSHIMVLKQCILHLGDSIHLRLDQRLHRQDFAVLKIM